MRDVWSLIQAGLAQFTRRGKIILASYGISLVILAGLDAGALFLLARVLNLGAISDSSDIRVSTSAASLLTILILFCLRSILSSVTTYLALRQGAVEETLIGERSLETMINPRTRLSADGLSDFYNSVDRGPKELVIIVFHAVTTVCEAITAMAILGALITYQPLTALVALLYFIVVAFVQQSVLSRRSSTIGDDLVRETNRVYALLADAHGLRQILAKSSARSLLTATTGARTRLTQTRALHTFVASFPRYFLEVILAIGLLVVGGTTYLVAGPPEAFAATALFVATGFRLLPIVNRIQALSLAIFAYMPTARLALQHRDTQHLPAFSTPSDHNCVLELANVEFGYYCESSLAVSDLPVLRDVSLRLMRGQQYALVGPSGSGKTTLANLLLGINVAQRGTMYKAGDVVAAYVPQDTYIAGISLRRNIALQWSEDHVDRERVIRSAEQAGLSEFISKIDDDTALNSLSLSGGQKQRIGLARALYSGANFFVFDEVTSALDSETEKLIYDTINGLRGTVTVLIIAHRLSTIQQADQLFYLADGTIRGSGSFSQLINSVPSFRKQVELSQIDPTP